MMAASGGGKGPGDRPVRRSLYWRFNRALERITPRGLYGRSMLIILAPIILLQTIMIGVILDRHWDQVTKTLSRGLVREISLTVDLYEQSDRSPAALARIKTLINQKLALDFDVERNTTLPAPVKAPLISPVDDRLNHYLALNVAHPFWIDTRGEPGRVDVRVEVEKGLIFRFFPGESRAYAVETRALIYWMIGSSLVLLGVAIIFLHNQIQPIVELARAARNFGLGRGNSGFTPRGASEVREAGLAFANMRDRIERHVEQRTGMLTGVSHDLRTVLTRFRLELALLKDNETTRALREDVGEMQRMLEAYIAFAKGDSGEKSEPRPIAGLLEAVTKAAMRGSAVPIAVHVDPDLVVSIKPNDFQRLLANLVGNAVRYAKTVNITVEFTGPRLRIVVDDDGPGIPGELREEVFRPFVRLDYARNQDESGTGLGLAIARDIARAHGGDVTLADSPPGGLRAIIEIPV